MEHVKNGVPGIKYKVKESVKDNEKLLRKYVQNMQDLWNTIKHQTFQSWV
jgi:hypothetical protein